MPCGLELHTNGAIAYSKFLVQLTFFPFQILYAKNRDAFLWMSFGNLSCASGNKYMIADILCLNYLVPASRIKGINM